MDVLLPAACQPVRQQSSVSAPEHLAPVPSAEVKDAKMFVGEPFRPMVSSSISGSSFRVLKSNTDIGLLYVSKKYRLRSCSASVQFLDCSNQARSSRLMVMALSSSILFTVTSRPSTLDVCCIGNLRQVQLLCDLRAYLCGITVDCLTGRTVRCHRPLRRSC